MNIKNNFNNAYLINEIVLFIRNKHPDLFQENHIRRKFTLHEIISNLLLILQYGLSYNNTLNGISGKTLNYYMLIFTKYNIFKNVYTSILEKYIEKNKAQKLKFQSIDTSYVQNKYGVSKFGRNVYYKSKRGYKLSIITDIHGIPISVLLDACNIHDTQFVKEHLCNFLIDPETHKYKKCNKYKQYILADKGYCSSNIKKEIIEKGYELICPKNKRNTKNKKKIVKMTNKKREIYKRRIIVENSFSWIKMNKRINNIHEKKFETYLSFVYLSLIKLICKRI
jgi:transposase